MRGRLVKDFITRCLPDHVVRRLVMLRELRRYRREGFPQFSLRYFGKWEMVKLQHAGFPGPAASQKPIAW